VLKNKYFIVLKHIYYAFNFLEVSSGCGDESKEESIAAAPGTGKATST
jgi:hypothetical protein